MVTTLLTFICRFRELRSRHLSVRGAVVIVFYGVMDVLAFRRGIVVRDAP